MQWGQIKTLFILCFFLLDIYLLFLVIQKQDNEDLAYKEQELQDQEKILESENITVTDNLPEPIPDEPFVTITPKTFSEEEIELIMAQENQEIEVLGNSYIFGKFKKKIAIPENASKEDIAKLVTSSLYLGTEYALEYWDKEKNVLLFFQKKNDRPIYYNQNGMVMVYLNEKNEMVAYTQSVLGDLEIINDKKSLITPFSAIYTLYDNRLLLSNDEVTNVEIGYHTAFPLENGKQVLVPTWRVTIDGSKERFVNAVERSVKPVDDDFVNNVLQLSIDNIILTKNQDDFKESMLAILRGKLDLNRSEEE